MYGFSKQAERRMDKEPGKMTEGAGIACVQLRRRVCLLIIVRLSRPNGHIYTGSHTCKGLAAGGVLGP